MNNRVDPSFTLRNLASFSWFSLLYVHANFISNCFPHKLIIYLLHLYFLLVHNLYSNKTSKLVLQAEEF